MYRRLLELKAPSIIKKRNRVMVLRALLASALPSVENLMRRIEEQIFFDSLCARRNGWNWCKRGKGHSGPCVYKWNRAADLLELGGK